MPVGGKFARLPGQFPSLGVEGLVRDAHREYESRRLKTGSPSHHRCPWPTKGLDIEYHDTEWGRPHHDDRALFELLILEGAQAGLSWTTILAKRENYRKAFDGFDAKKIAKYGARKTASLLADSGIVRNRLKIAATIQNAKSFLDVQREFGSFDRYL